MPLSSQQLSNLHNRLAASEKSGDYNARNFVDVPRQDLKQLLDDHAQLRKEVERGKTLCTAVRNVVAKLADSPRSLLTNLQEGIPHLTAFIEGKPEP